MALPRDPRETPKNLFLVVHNKKKTIKFQIITIKWTP